MTQYSKYEVEGAMVNIDGNRDPTPRQLRALLKRLIGLVTDHEGRIRDLEQWESEDRGIHQLPK